MDNAYYKPSGRLSLAFFLFYALLMAAGIPILSVAYIYSIHYVPFIYLNFIITIFCGAALGYLVSLAAKLGKARNLPVVIIFVIIGMGIMKYVQWGVYVPLVLAEVYEVYHMPFIDRFTEAFALIRDPGLLIDYAEIINEIGVWGISPNAGEEAADTVNGTLLTTIWAAEFLLMTGMAIFAVHKQPKYPFSEEFGGWYVRFENKVEMDVPDQIEILIDDMEKGKFADFVQLAKTAKSKDDNYLRLTFYHPPQPSYKEPYYVSIEQCGDQKKAKRFISKGYLTVDAKSVYEMTAPQTYADTPDNKPASEHAEEQQVAEQLLSNQKHGGDIAADNETSDQNQL